MPATWIYFLVRDLIFWPQAVHLALVKNCGSPQREFEHFTVSGAPQASQCSPLNVSWPQSGQEA
jgi:hypothetical protein